MDEIECLKAGIKENFIKFDTSFYSNPDNFYVKDAGGFLSYLTKLPFKCEKVYPQDYIPKQGEYAVELWSMDGGVTGHFAITSMGFNSLQTSLNVEQGKIHSYRVFTRG